MKDFITQYRSTKVLTLLLVFIFSLIFVRTAWVGDDGYITLRTVDNFVHGYGLRWNIDERVQSYTHPLWLFLLIPVYAVTKHAYFTVLFVSFACSLTLFLLIRYRIETPIFSLAVLLLSKAFMDYSASGLENPASHLLIITFWLCLLRWEQSTAEQKDIFPLSLTGALLVLNRLDAVLFVLPMLAYLLYTNLTSRTWVRFACGLTPLIVWVFFSLFYYGFLFPNTYYAKLNTGISHDERIEQGLVYFVDSIQRDPLTLTVILAGILFTFWRSDKMYAKQLAFGNLIYLGYVMWIGGDFMSGRFFTSPLLISTLLLTSNIHELPRLHKIIMGGIIVVLGLWASPSNLDFNWKQPRFTEHDLITGINDERAFYYPVSGLMFYRPNHPVPFIDEGWGERGIALRDNGVKVSIQKNVGFVGYFAGPSVHIIDQYALCDPLLARLPVAYSDDWRIGHFEREIPKGYLATLRTGQNSIQDPDLAAYYDKLSLIVSGPLWSRSRLRAIFEMNTGQYDHFLLEYFQEAR